MAVTVVAKLRAKAGSEASLEQALRAMVPKVRDESGTLSYVLHRSVREPGVFVFYEIYQDQAALDAHTKTPHFKGLVAAVGPLLDGRMHADVLVELDRK
jgi:quinol monooxygenase YgiN